MKSCVAALSAAVVLTAMPAQVNAAPTKSVTVSTQKSLNAALKNSKVGTITIKTSKDIKISIPKGKFTSKSVVMNASKASLTNNGTLKGMIIKSAKIVTEKADNNKINITDKGLRLIVAKGADNSKVSIGTKDAKVTVVADGKVASVTVNKKALVAVTGTTTKPVSVTSTVAGTGLILASKANVSLKNSTNVDVRKGADLGTVTAYDNASLKVAKGAKIATFNSTGDKASVKLVKNGAVGNVVLKKKATVTITGEPTKKVAVTNNASGSLVKLGVKADVKATQPTTVNAYKGSEIGKVTATKDLVLNVGSGAKVDTVLATKAVEVNANKGSEVGTVTGSQDVAVNVAVGAKVDTVKSQGEDAKVTVSANGTLGDVIIDGKAEVKVEGTTATSVNVTSNAADSVVSVSAASKITLNESATVNVAEGAKVESLTAAKDVAVNVDAKAEVAEVVVKGEDAKVDVTANGTVGAVTVDAKAEVSIKGETDSSVVVNANVESAKINTEVKTEVNANANVDITLGEGAEGSKVVAGEDVNASVKNETKEDVTVTDSTGKDTKVDSGSTGDTKPAPVPTPAPPAIVVPVPKIISVYSKDEMDNAVKTARSGDTIKIYGVTNFDGTNFAVKEGVKVEYTQAAILEILNGTRGYKHTPEYTYKRESCEFTMKDGSIDCNVEYNINNIGNEGKNIMYDLARMLGAIYRENQNVIVNDKKVINQIEFNKEVFEWRGELGLDGSNWYKKDVPVDETNKAANTLVSKIVKATNLDKISLEIGGVTVNFYRTYEVNDKACIQDISNSLKIGDKISVGGKVVGEAALKDGSVILEYAKGVKYLLDEAAKYTYNNHHYNYMQNGLEITDVNNNKVTVTFKYTGGEDALKITKENGPERPVGKLVDDIARYLGAIYRCNANGTDGNKIVSQIKYSDIHYPGDQTEKVYTWNTEPINLKGSNWRTSDGETTKTLMSTMFPSGIDIGPVGTYIQSLSRKIKIGDVEVEFKAELNSQTINEQ